jgi:hypothetical protein
MTLVFLMNKRRHNSAGLSLKKDKWLSNQRGPLLHFKLSHSRAFFMRAYLQQTHEMLLDAHYHAFQCFNGVPERGIYDNMKTAVDKIGRGKQRHVNKRFIAMISHYLFEAEFCNPASGWEKGPNREERIGCPASCLARCPRLSLAGRTQYLAQTTLYRALAGAAASRGQVPDRL